MWIDTPVFKEDMDYVLGHAGIDWEKFRDTVILVTGGTGLIGSTVISSLLYADLSLQLGIKIVALVRDPAKAEVLFREQLCAGSALTFLKGNVEDLPTMDGRVDYIIHCASPTASAFFVNQPVETIRIAVQGTINLLELAKRAQVRGMAYLSSMEIYGQVHTEELLAETRYGLVDPLNVRSSYPESKRMCECLCASYAAEYGVPVCQVRLAQTFGAGVGRGDKRVFAMMARAAIHGEDIVLQTAGTSKHSYLYTAQAVTAILTVLQKGHPGHAYNAANPDTYCSIREMGEMVASQIADGRIRVVIAQNGDASKYPAPGYLNLDISAIKELGWSYDYDLAWMYRRMIAAMGCEK